MNKAQRIEAAQNWINTLNSSKYETHLNTAIESTHYVSIEEASEQLDKLRSSAALGHEKTNVKVFCNDVSVCTKASLTHNKGRVCVMDFASYTNPGGGFINGAMAQEEDICNMSGLYPCLESKQDVYTERKSMLNDHVFNNDYFYVQTCPFIINGKVYLADVMAIAAPNSNKTSASHDEISKALHERMELAFLVPHVYGCKNIVLGAFGCGVFGNDVDEVASIWKELQTTYDGLYSNIAYAVKDKDMVKTFRSILE